MRTPAVRQVGGRDVPRDLLNDSISAFLLSHPVRGQPQTVPQGDAIKFYEILASSSGGHFLY